MDLILLPPSSLFGWALVQELRGFDVSDLFSISGLSSEVIFWFLPLGLRPALRFPQDSSHSGDFGSVQFQ